MKKTVVTYMSQEEADLLKKAAKKEFMSVSAFMRKSAVLRANDLTENKQEVV